MSRINQTSWQKNTVLGSEAEPLGESAPKAVGAVDIEAVSAARCLRLAALLLALVLPLPFLLNPAPRPPPAWEDIDLAGLPEIRSRLGVLSATLVAAPLTVRIGPAEFAGASFNGTYAGPVLRARPGDLVRITLINHLTEPTNLHFHGLRVTPQGRGDNVHIVVPPGKSFDYEFTIPLAQPGGLFWYHDHLHGLTESHVAAGLGGALLIEGFTTNLPALRGLAQKLLVFKDVSLPDCQGALLKKQLHCRVVSIDGSADWRTTMRPGETQLWRLCNQGANLLAHLAVPGARLQIIGRDGTPAAGPTEAATLDIMPASRLDVLVTANRAGTLSLLAKNTLTGAGSTMAVNRVLGTITVAGKAATPLTEPISFPRLPDLRTGPIGTHRLVVFTENEKAAEYYLNGKMFDHRRLDMRVPYGTVEEWTVKNRTNDFHEFHIHQLGFQVISINGAPQDFNGYLDDVLVPEMGEVKLLIPFTDPATIGLFVYHCHVLKHEDHGMMANIEVYRQGAAATPHICLFAGSDQ